jgi:hypothetical protein
MGMLLLHKGVAIAVPAVSTHNATSVQALLSSSAQGSTVLFALSLSC